MTFSNSVEKYNEKMSMWSKTWLVIDTPGLFFYDKRPVTKSQASLCKEYISFEGITIRVEKEFRRGSMRKAHVIQFQMNKCSLRKSTVNDISYIILTSFKNEVMFEQAQSVLTDLKRLKPVNQGLNKRKTRNMPKALETAREGSKYSRDTIMSNIADRESETIETDYQKFSKMNTKKPIVLKQSRVQRGVSINTTSINPPNSKKQRTKSCFDFTTITHDNPKEKPNNTVQQFTSDKEVIVQQKEENMSLGDLLNQMLSSSSKKGQPIQLMSNMKSSAEISSPTSLHQTKRKEQINSIIDMNINQSIEEPFQECKPAQLNTIDINSYIEPNMLTLGRKESEDFRETTRIEELSLKLDENEIFIYDSFLFRKFRKEQNVVNKELGQLFIQSQSTQVKTQLLTEIIGLLSKKFLKKSITKSLEIVLKEKDINKNYFVSSSHQHSIKYCIVDLFNSFLGNNSISNELYSRVLPRYIKDTYGIDLVLIKQLKKRLCFASLFIIMEYHNRVYFNVNREIDFNEPYPFQSSNIKYISPYLISKMLQKAQELLSSIALFHNDDIDINSSSFLSENSHRHSRNALHSISTTNAKRLKNNFAQKQSGQTEQASLLKLKRYEESNDNCRINLIKAIHHFVIEKKHAYALKLCDYYIQKYSDTISLNAFAYLFLAEIYNEIDGIDYAKLFMEKIKDLMTWLYPDNNCFFIADCYYTFSLIFLKQSDAYIKEHVEEINDYLFKANELSQRYYKPMNEKSIKISLQMVIFKLSYLNPNDFNRTDYQKLLRYLDYFYAKHNYTTLIAYLDLFIDLFSNMTSINRDEGIIKELLQRIHIAKKESNEE